MKKLFHTLFFVFFSAVFLPGCIDLIEDMVLNKDGSGKYALTIDMGKMMKDPLMKGMIEAGNNDEKKDMDSIIYFKDLPDSIIKDNPDLWSRVTMRIYNNVQEGSFLVKINFNFKRVEEIAYLSANINKVMQATKANPVIGDEPGRGGPSGLLDEGLVYVLKGKELIRKTGSKTAETPDEDMQMLKSIMGGAEYRLNIEMPGRIKQVSIPNARVDGRKLMVTTPFLDIMQKKATMDGSITYK